ncbi:DUF4832 domain-containing protein [Butyrivibrio sp. X503]|uniref:DUF4832 domain-containing protein n=1 Tax=Butyrivibrio sp. X503 TaxID=2364878 RepID=UPI001314D558|nr:DUF4832 domain-containing protein [Butyrivibrio sp. X503]
MNLKKTNALRLFMSTVVTTTTMVMCAAPVHAENLGSTISLEESGAELENVERGECPYTWVTVSDGATQVLYPSGGMYSIMYDLRYFSNGNDFSHQDYQTANGCGGYKSLSEHPDFLNSLKETLQNARNSGTSIVLRFSYASDNTAGNEPSKTGENGAEPDIDLILKHISELAPVINEYKDTVLAVECGMYGPWGEMHTSMYDEPQYYSQLSKAWLSNLDSNIKVLVRSPKHLMAHYGFGDKGDEFAAAIDNGSLRLDPRLGMYNDGYLGTSTDVGTFGAENSGSYITRETAADLLQRMDTVPYGGEMAYLTLSDLQSNGSIIYDEPALMGELYMTHLSYLHNINESGHTIAGELDKLTVSEDFILPGADKKDFAPYIDKSYREFIRDHMGYRLLVKESDMSETLDSDGTFTMTGAIKNTGFGNFLTDKKAEVILKNGDDTFVSSIDNFNAKELKSLATMNYDWSFEVPSELSAGNWDVYLRIKNATDTGETSKTGIAFANKDCFDEDLCANKIGTISISSDDIKETPDQPGTDASTDEPGAATSTDEPGTDASTDEPGTDASTDEPGTDASNDDQGKTDKDKKDSCDGKDKKDKKDDKHDHHKKNDKKNNYGKKNSKTYKFKRFKYKKH